MNEEVLNNILISASDSIFEKDYSTAEKTLLEGLDKFSGNYLIHYNLGALYLEAGMPEKALPCLLEAEKLCQTDPDVYIDAALAWQRTGEMESAFSCYRSALGLALSPHQEAVIYNNMGAIHFDRSDFREAARLFRKSLSIENDYEEARQNLLLANTYLEITGLD